MFPRKSCNAAKNRYKDVICYDKTRVQLSSVPAVDGSDYIHANYVDGYKSKNHFILTQGLLLMMTPYLVHDTSFGI